MAFFLNFVVFVVVHFVFKLALLSMKEKKAYQFAKNFNIKKASLIVFNLEYFSVNNFFLKFYFKIN